MKLNAVSLQTWLLGAIAGLAVLVLLLAHQGMGSRIAPLPAEPTQAAQLPQWHAPAHQRLGPLDQYGHISARPLYFEDRQPHPFHIPGAQPDEEVAQPFDYTLSSVLITPELRMAILTPGQDGGPLRVKEGEVLEPSPQWRLAEVQPRSVVLDGPQGRRVLELRVYDGAGGQAPVPPAAPFPPASPVSRGVTTADAPAALPRSKTASSAVTIPPGAAAVAASAAESASQAAAAQQLEEVRKRIEARRKQWLEQEARPANR